MIGIGIDGWRFRQLTQTWSSSSSLVPIQKEESLNSHEDKVRNDDHGSQTIG